MSTTTVSKLASALKLSDDKLILQLNDAGIDVTSKDDVVSNDQKLVLLNHLRGSHGTKSTVSSAPKKLTINRRSQSELKLSGSFGKYPAAPRRRENMLGIRVLLGAQTQEF